MWKKRLLALLVLLIGVGIAYFVYASEVKKMAANAQPIPVPAWFPGTTFKLGLDLSGGSHLVYRADLSQLKGTSVTDAMNSLRDVIERRINIFGVSEPVVQVENSSFTNGGEQRLIVDLPGVTDIEQAIAMIGQTPLLEFKTENPNPKPIQATVGADGKVELGAIDMADRYISTQLTGRYLSKATLQFNPNTGEPEVSLTFDAEGAKLFEELTKANIGKTIAIFLDGAPLSTPTVQQAIVGGQAQITGSFTPQEAKQLVSRLNSGALPVPISLISTQTIGPSLGAEAVKAGVHAGLIGFLLIALFLILWYRLPGVIAVLALILYVAITLALYKLIPVTLTAAGIAGFIISIGIAVDANVLIFERIKEEIRGGRAIPDAIATGFSRAWFSIRDSNISTFITSLILFWFGTSLIKGFALTLGLGVIISLFSAVVISRLFLLAIGANKTNAVTSFLFGSGFSGARSSK
jgi:preprotein translocase subunit SecD